MSVVDSPQEPGGPVYLPPTAEQLRQIAAKHGFDGQDIRPLPATGVVNWVFAIGDAAVLRVSNGAHPDAVSDALTESVAVPAVHAAGIRTPRLLVLDDSHDAVDALFTIYERVPGQDLASRTAAGKPVPDRLYRELGRELARLHHNVTEVPDPNGWLDAKPRWGSVDAVATVLGSPLVDPNSAGVLTSLRDGIEPILQQAGTFRRFLHQDISPGNVMSNDGEFAAIIDWGDAGWGDPVQDFKRLPLRAVDLMLAGYREVMPIEGDDTAEARILWDHMGNAAHRLRTEPDLSHEPGCGTAHSPLRDLLGFLRSDLGQRWIARAPWRRPSN